MKKLLFSATLVVAATVTHAQDIKIKDHIVYIDDQECLKIQSSDPNNVSFTDLDGNELLFLKFIHNSKYGPLYTKVTFLDQKLSFTSKSYIFNKKLLIKKLVADKTLEHCKLNPAKVEKFVLKYDENVESY